MILDYDGSFNGFLSVIFHVYSNSISNVQIVKENDTNIDIFEQRESIKTFDTGANRVKKGLINNIGKNAFKTFYYAFLNDKDHIENVLFSYCQYIFKTGTNINSNYSNEAVLQVSKWAKSVSREKHRMEAFVRFRLTKENIYFAMIEPDFNVLPLINRHFTDRYADQKWIIYDVKRKWGLFYDLNKTIEITMSFDDQIDIQKTPLTIFDEDELAFQQLWKSYFTSSNIKSRANQKLHVQHVPKRYWKYLSEKNTLL